MVVFYFNICGVIYEISQKISLSFNMCCLSDAEADWHSTFKKRIDEEKKDWENWFILVDL